nr:reverse transcriptase domain-containing protein [Tanacetum cinerariifolium]
AKTSKKEETLGKEKQLDTNGEEDGTEGPMIIEAKIRGHFIHRMYVDEGSSLEIMYENSFNRFPPEVTISIQRNNKEAKSKENPCSAVYSSRNAKIPSGRRKVTLRSSRIIPLECTMVSGPEAPERNKAIYEEVEKLVDASIMKEVHYHSWLSNPVMVKKHDDNWRMSVDFIDLNKAGPKDGYPLLETDWKLEFLCGYPFKCFMDAYKGYHQIKLAKEDKEKTALITSQGIFCY